MNKNQMSAFWSKVDIKKTSQCWVWLGAKNNKGYGKVRVNKKYLGAHRVAFEVANKIKIPEGLCACHICDNPSCCNPNHIMLGTIKSNAADMVLKHRCKPKEYAARGSGNGNSKLKDGDIKNIRKLYKTGKKNQYELATMYGVAQTNIGNIVRNKTWRHLL